MYRETNMCEDAFAHIDCDIGNYVMFCKLCLTHIRHLITKDQLRLVLANYYVFLLAMMWAPHY
jgi:hypothetical protein